MNETRRSHRRAGPLFGVVLLVVTGVLAFTPAVAPVGAIDPTPTPTAELPTPPPDPTPDPTPAPTPDPTPDPTPAPTPTADPSASPDPSADPSASPDPSAGPTDSPPPSASPEPSASPAPSPGGLRVAHTWVDVAARVTEAIVPGALDAPRGGAERYRVYVVRFQVVNDGDEVLDLSPRVAVAPDGGAFRAVPAVDPVDGVPFYAATDDGKSFQARTFRIPPSALRLDAADGRAVPGLSVWGVADPPPVRLAAGTFTEVEFAVRATVDAGWERSYDFRLLDAGAAVAGPRASITLRARPAIRLTPGQRDGVDVDPPVRYALQLTPSAPPPDLTRYALLGPQAGFLSPHGDASLVSDTCAACHSSHVAQNRMLNQEPPPQANQCFTCHDGSGAEANVAAEFEDPAVPANNPATSAWYSHPATTGSTHLSDREDEFGGVLDRHAECADCHQPHVADASLSTETPGGWSASGALKGASGVRVANGAAGTAPTYTWAPTTELEYQLCFKCHSGFTQLPARDPAHPSRWALDKAVELNPANLSYHPVQAAGTNQTSQMAASLAGTSPYKLWAFTTSSTIRCLNCHGDSRQATPAAPPDAAARLAPHAVKNQGLLIANYRNGDPAAGPPATSGLKGSGEAYSAADFALCYTCHGEAPFVDWTGDPRGDTRFGFHGLHTYAIGGEGTGGTDIDVDGDGQGLAICAECHYRIHGTTDAVDGQPATSRLVNFAPNVQPRNGRIEWIGGATPSCTVNCHGKNHTDYSY